MNLSPYGITSKLKDSSSSSSAQGQQRQRSHIATSPTAGSDAHMVDVAAAPKQPAAAAAGSSSSVELPLVCPVLLVRQYHGGAGSSGSSSSGSTSGWSLLLPAGWVLPFWQALTHAGAPVW
jgi:hypothetical protein